MTKDQQNNESPAVLMLMSRQCTYCGPMMQALIELMKAGQIAELRIVNIESRPEVAMQLGVRSVPWLRIGPFELLGSRSKQEMLLWIERTSSPAGFNAYLDEVLSEGRLEYAKRLLESHPQVLVTLIEMMADPEAKINVRLGVGVLIEDMAESVEFRAVIPRLIDYLSSKDARIRGDACHYLSLTKDASQIPLIERLLSDESEEVREIAQDSLDELSEKQ
jgi:hypothetical protein